MVALLAGLNLTTQLTASHLPQLQFVRLRELLSLLFITPVSLALLFRIIWALEGGRRDAKWVMTLFVISAALVAVAMGVHEPINALRNTANKSELALMSDSLWFWDDLFSHVVFFAGCVGTSLTLILSQMRNPLPEPINRFSIAIFGICAMVGGAGIYASLVQGGRIRVDLAIIAGVILTAEWMRKRRSFKVLPIALTIEGSYVLAFMLLTAHRLHVVYTSG